MTVEPAMTETNDFSHSDFFPYAKPRAGQSEMMIKIDNAVHTKTDICCEAPNGFGKTSVTLCGTLPWIKKNRGKILYCARTHKQLDRVMEELTVISERVPVSGISFRGRSHMCLNQFVLENAGRGVMISEVCGELKTSGKCAYYERLKALGSPESILADMPKKVLTAPDIVKIAKKRSLCPYELAKSLARAVDVLALSYLYVFDPAILETFILELDTPLSKVVLVEDEAHNVPDTALSSASDSLTIGSVRLVVREAGTPYHDEVSKKFARALTKYILDKSKDMKSEDEVIVDPMQVYNTTIEEAGLSNDEDPLAHMKRLGLNIRMAMLKSGKFPTSAIFRVAEFMQNWIYCADKDNYTFILSRSERRSTRRVALELVALDPTAVTSPVLRKIRCAVAISGTMSPLSAYAEMLGFGEGHKEVTFQSPFARQNRLGIIVDGLDTSYRNRSDRMFKRLVEHCVTIADTTPSNTGIFTTSYGIAKSLLDAGLERKLRKRLFREKPGMKTQENDRMIKEFKEMGNRDGAVLLGVQGGRNSEGGDFPGQDMECVVVVGVPYARPTPRIEAMIKYFDWRFNKRGRDYAYVLPAMTRAIQAAGRPVRRLDDLGAIVLLDQRFSTPYLKRFLPAWLTDVTEVLPDDTDIVAQQLEFFFNTHQ